MSQARPDTSRSAAHSDTANHRPRSPNVLALAALGVVFGDIGTSPLYAMQAIFTGDHPIEPTPGDVYGVISLVAWSLTLMVSVKFVLFVMRADNEGEGGVMALYALVRRATIERQAVKTALLTAGIIGVALFFADAMITPAISVLSAVEGVEVAAPGLSSPSSDTGPQQWVGSSRRSSSSGSAHSLLLGSLRSHATLRPFRGCRLRTLSSSSPTTR
jgi:KUP system potassium uptake protein